MFNGKIHIKNVEEARAFFEMTARYPDLRITLESDEYKVDGHSIIGILSLDLSRPLTISADGEDTEAFIDDLQPFTV